MVCVCVNVYLFKGRGVHGRQSHGNTRMLGRGCEPSQLPLGTDRQAPLSWYLAAGLHRDLTCQVHILSVTDHVLCVMIFWLSQKELKEMVFSSRDSFSLQITSPGLGPHGLQPTRLLYPWNSPGKNTGEGSHSLLHGIFLTQGSNLGLLHCRQILYHLSLQGSPNFYRMLCRIPLGGLPLLLNSCPMVGKVRHSMYPKLVEMSACAPLIY